MVCGVTRPRYLLSPKGDRVILGGTTALGSEKEHTYVLQANLVNGKVEVIDQGLFADVVSWAPGGDAALYMKEQALYLVEIDTGKKVKLADNCFYGTFSPDGSKIACTPRDKGILIFERSGQFVKQVTQGKGDWYPLWYPDGKAIFYFGDLGKTLTDGAGQLQGLTKVDVTTGKVEKLFPEEQGKYRQAQWIVPGEALHVIKGWDDGYFEMIVNIDSGQVIPLGENSSQQYSTTVNNKKGLLYKIEQGQISVYNAKGQQVDAMEIKLPENNQYIKDFGYTIAPDGSKLAFHFGEMGYSMDSPIKGRKIMLLDLATKQVQELTKEFADYQQILWTPDSENVITIESAKTNVDQKFILTILK